MGMILQTTSNTSRAFTIRLSNQLQRPAPGRVASSTWDRHQWDRQEERRLSSTTSHLCSLHLHSSRFAISSPIRSKSQVSTLWTNSRTL